MRAIAIINQKGGVGKTTTAVNLSAALAQAGKRVCLIDLDPQAHASLHLGLETGGQEPSVYDVLTSDASLADVQREIEPGLFVAPSHIDLAAAELELAGVVGRELIVREKLAAIRGQFDYVLIDCPPSLGVLTLNALCAVDEVILPLQPHFLALHGMSKLLETIELVALRLNSRLRLSGVALCLFESGTRLAAEVSRDVEAFFASARGTNKPWSDVTLFRTPIRRNIRLAEAPSFGQSIFQYAADSNGAADYRELALELLESGEPRAESGEPEGKAEGGGRRAEAAVAEQRLPSLSR